MSVRFTEASLASVGVEIRNRAAMILSCTVCHKGWSPLLGRGGQLPPGWWKCPNGCNAEQGAS